MSLALSSRKLLKLLSKHGCTLLEAGRGKGAHTMVQRVLADGRKVKTTVPHERGDLRAGTLQSIRRKLELDQTHGFDDAKFTKP